MGLRFMKRIQKYFLGFKDKIRIGPTRSINGYSTWLALVCLALLIQVNAILIVQAIQQVSLVQASKQSTIDLSCISQAKHIILYNQMVVRCGLDESKRIDEKTVKMGNMDVRFVDHKTYVEITYPKDGRSVVMKIYYDDKAIVSMDIDSV